MKRDFIFAFIEKRFLDFINYFLGCLLKINFWIFMKNNFLDFFIKTISELYIKNKFLGLLLKKGFVDFL